MLDFKKFDEPGPAAPPKPAKPAVDVPVPPPSVPSKATSNSGRGWKAALASAFLVILVGGGVAEYEQHQQAEQARKQEEYQRAQAEAKRRAEEELRQAEQARQQEEYQRAQAEAERRAAEELRRQLEPRAEIEKVWTDHNVLRNSDKGMVIHTEFKIDNLQGQQFEAIACVYFDNTTEDPVKTSAEDFQTEGSDLCVWRSFAPEYKSTEYKDFSLFLPNRTIDTGDGQWNLKYRVVIRRPGGDWAELAKSEWQRFQLTR